MSYQNRTIGEEAALELGRAAASLSSAFNVVETVAKKGDGEFVVELRHIQNGVLRHFVDSLSLAIGLAEDRVRAAEDARILGRVGERYRPDLRAIEAQHNHLVEVADRLNIIGAKVAQLEAEAKKPTATAAAKPAKKGKAKP
jgi:hypothetical protein